MRKLVDEDSDYGADMKQKAVELFATMKRKVMQKMFAGTSASSITSDNSE